MDATRLTEMTAALADAYTADGLAATYVPASGDAVAVTLLLDRSKSSVEVYLMAESRTEIMRLRKSEVSSVHVQQDHITKTADSSSWLVQMIVVEDELEFVLAIVKDV